MHFANFRLEPVEQKAENPAERYCDFAYDIPPAKKWRAEAAAAGATWLSAGGARNLTTELRSNDDSRRLMSNGRGTAVLHLPLDYLVRTTVTSAGISPAPERMPGIVPEPRRRLHVQNMLTTVPVSSSLVEWVRVVSHAKVVSPQVEGQIKAENEITFEKREEKVRTIATWIPASKQILEDFEGLEAFLRSSLVYAVEEEFEDQLLFGSGSGENLNGLVTQAATFNTGLLGTNWTKIDVIGRAIHQLAAADELMPDFIVMHPADYWQIALTKDVNGRYLVTDPQNASSLRSLFGLSVVESTAMAPGQFLLGTSNPAAAQIRMRQPISVEISTEHSDYFTRNLVAIRAELRAALVVMRPGAFVKGSLTSSPA
jgi:HK97 family phage major capsid protein